MSSSRDTSNNHERAVRRDRVARMFLEGLSTAAIAGSLRVSVQTIRRDIRRLRKSWRAILERDFHKAKSQELAKIDRLEAEAWEAWKRSIEPEKTTKAFVEGNKKRAESVTKSQVGDMKFLAQVNWCVEKRCEILSLSAAKTGSAKGADQLSPDQLRKRVAALLTLIGERERTGTA